MAAEEFQESEVIFSDIHDTHHQEEDGGGYFGYRAGFSRKEKTNNKKEVDAGSLPVSIPYRHGSGVFRCGGGDSEEECELVPPHVILGRRLSGKMAFSVCTGTGRTLKGRDLSQVRNSILRLTGFLEA